MSDQDLADQLLHESGFDHFADEVEESYGTE